MLKNKLLTGLLCGFAIAVISIIPVLSSLNCCVFVPLIAYGGVFVYNKANSKEDFTFRLNAGDTILLALIIGLFAGIFESLLQSLMIYVSRTNPLTEAIRVMEDMMKDLPVPGFIIRMEKEIQDSGFSLLFIIFMFISTFLMNTVMSIVGSLIGYSVINRNSNKTTGI